jgi:hypothetical protein
LSNTFKSVGKPTTIITVDESWEQLPHPGDWELVVKQTAAEKKADKAALEAEKAAVDEEAKRIAELPIHVGETVKLNETALAAALDVPDATPEALDKATAWRGLVVEVRRDEETDTDVAVFDDGTHLSIVDSLEVVTAE